MAICLLVHLKDEQEELVQMNMPMLVAYEHGIAAPKL